MAKFLWVVFLLFGVGAHAQTVDFSYDSTKTFCNPSVIRFQAQAEGSPQGFFWNFGNGMVSDSRTPSIRFASAGTYHVELVVIYEKYTKNVRKDIVIHPAVQASVSPDRDFICTEGAITFNARSNLPANYQWFFGDGETYQGEENMVSHTFSRYESYTVKVVAQSDAGCTDTAQTIVKLEQPSLTGSSDNNSGCIPATNRFTTTAVIPKNSTVTSYEWDFNDGSPLQTTTTRSISHVYQTTGNFSPTVKMTTSEGCTQTYTFDDLAYGIPPENLEAGAASTQFCGSDSASFFASATNANGFIWEFGDGQSGESESGEIQHKYRTVGAKTAYVTPFFNECPADPQEVQVQVIGVVGSFRFENTCGDKNTFQFTNTTNGHLSSLHWTISGAGSDTSAPSFSHTFPVSGESLVSLFVEDELTGCKDRVNAMVYTALPVLQSSDTSVCRNTEVGFHLDSNYSSRRAQYTWNVAGKRVTGNAPNVRLNADRLGVFQNYVVVDLGSHYCKDTVRLKEPLKVRGPLLDFNSAADVCFNEPYSIYNFSRPFFAGEDIRDWHWNYGETTVNDTIYQPQPYTFTRAGTFNVKLQATDIRGCTDSLVKSVRVNPLPFLYVVPKSDTLCLGQTDSLLAFYNGSLSWSSDFELPCMDCDTMLISPPRSTVVVGTATSSRGCSVSDSVHMVVHQPFTASTLVKDPYICLNDTTEIEVSPRGKRVDWEPLPYLFGADSSRAVVAPPQTTTYAITLTDSAGCFSETVNAVVNVKSLPHVDAGPDQILGWGETFHINPAYSENTASYTWSPSRTLSCTTCPNPSGVLYESQLYRVEVVSDSGCVANDSIAIIVECKDANLLVPNAFTPNGDRLNDMFYPIGRGIKIIRSFTVFDRYGKRVFERKNFLPSNRDLGWDGKRDGMDADPNVYVFYIEAECYRGEIIQRKGTVTLLR